MPTITLEFTVTDEQQTAMQILSGARTSEQFQQFLRLALQVGLADFQEEAARATREGIFGAVATLTNDYKHTRATFEAPAKAAPEPEAEVQPRFTVAARRV